MIKALFVVLLATLANAVSALPRIAILIDDMGDNRPLGERALALNGAVSYAFLPHTAHAPDMARTAKELGRDVLLHAPMESEASLQLMGKGALTTSMSEEELRTQLRANLQSIPYVQGFNNHMGSVLTRDRQRMQWLFEEVKGSPLFFVDSRTTAESVALPEARRLGVPSVGRDIFLDHEESAEAVERQFERLLKIARERGYALAIGHPKRNTLAVLEKRLNALAQEQVELVPVSMLTGNRPVSRQYAALVPKPSKPSALKSPSTNRQPCQPMPAQQFSDYWLLAQRTLRCDAVGSE